MPFDPDDPRLTAYALGELDLADRDAVEAILRDDPDARGFVLGVEETARLLADELRHEATRLRRPRPGPPRGDRAAPGRAGDAGDGRPAGQGPVPRLDAGGGGGGDPRGGRGGDAAAISGAARGPGAARQGRDRRAGREVGRGPPRDGEDADRVPVLDAVPAEVAAAAAPAAAPAPVEAEMLAEAPATEALVTRKVEEARDQYKAGATRDLGSLARAETSAARPRALAAPAPARRTDLALGVAVPAPVAGRAVEAKSPMGGGMGGMGGGMGGGGGGMGGMPGSGPERRAGTYGFGRVATGLAAGPSGGQGEKAAKSEMAARGVAPVDSNRSMGRAEQTVDRAKAGRTVAEGFAPPANRQPVVVGTEGAGIANYQPNANGATPPGAALPYGMASQGQGAQAGSNPQAGQAGQNAAMMRGTQPGHYFYEAAQAPAANAATPGQPGPQGAANNMAQSVQNQVPIGGRLDGQYQTGVHVATLVPKGNATNFGLAQNGPAFPPPGPPLPAANLAAGLDLAQQVKPAAALPALQPGQAVAFAPAASGPMMQPPAGGVPVPGPGLPPMPAPAQVASAPHVDAFDALETPRMPADVPAQAAGKPAQAAQADKKLMAKEKVDFAGQKDLSAPAEPAQAPAKLADGLQDLAKAPVQLARADEAARARVEEEIRRELDTKRDEVRRLAEEAETLRRRVAREQTKVDRESYARFYDHPFLSVLPGNELSTFAIDVDTGSYANVRRFLGQGQLPPPDAVRIEELLNYFRYDDPAPKGDEPFSVNCEVAACPWDADHRLARVGLKGKTIDVDKRPPSNLVFLIDVSGSMSDLNKLPLLKAGMKLLVEQLNENDRVAIVTYSNDVKEAFPSTPCHRKAEILAAIDALQAGGGTNGARGSRPPTSMAEKNFLKGGGRTG